jgi:hypothetical protein
VPLIPLRPAWILPLAFLPLLLQAPLAAAPPAPEPRRGPTTLAPPPAAAAPAQAADPLPPAAFKRLLRQGTLEELEQACAPVIAADRLDRLRQLRDRLLSLHPAPQPLPVVLANAEVLLRCRQPSAALLVLDRISPAPGAERLQWLLLQWRAAQADLDHRRAALALERLTAARPERLEALQLPVLVREDGSVLTRPALDLLAEHLQARGFPQAAAQLLLASRDPGVAGARRRLEALALLQGLPAEEREALLEVALDQAAAAGAWGLAAELLDAQAALPSERARQRRLRLSPRIDDAYGEWRMLGSDPATGARRAELERQLRSPYSPGGHAGAEEDGNAGPASSGAPAESAPTPALAAPAAPPLVAPPAPAPRQPSPAAPVPLPLSPLPAP